MSDLWIRRGVGHYTEATDADLAERGYVKVREDRHNPLCVDGFTTVERNGNTEILTCLDCGGSGKALAEGVEYFEGASLGDGYWLPARLIDGEDT